MGTTMDFLKLLETDMALEILKCLDDPADFVRAASVSRFWRHFVITNGLSKQLCLRLFPQFSRVAHISEPSCGVEISVDVEPSNSMEWEILEREHKVYYILVRALTTIETTSCIEQPISASSTDNYPDESILNTLDPREIIRNRPSYWSSKGQSNPEVPETLIYKLGADLCVVTEIKVQPFQAYFQFGLPIYSAKSMRFRMGHLKFPEEAEKDLVDLALQQPADDKFVWTYTSQEFPMAQEHRLQSFKLPEHALCVGGYIQIELLGRVQRQQMDGLFYVCVSHVQVLGCPLFPFKIEILEPSGKFSLKYNPEAEHTVSSLGATLVLPALPLELAEENFVQVWNNDFDDEWDEEENDFDGAVIL